MHMRRFVVSMFPALVLGCAAAPAAPPPTNWGFASASPEAGNELRMRSQARYVQVSINGSGINGATFNLSHDGTYIRGMGPGQTVIDVQLQGTRAVGNARNQPFTVDLAPEVGFTRVTGLFGGALSDFKISPAAFEGRVGTCGYDLTWTGGRYEGQLSCGGTVQQASLELPMVMASWSDLEVATVLGIVLGT